MSVSEDKIEHERIARQAAIKAALAESEPKAEASATSEPTAPLIPIDQDLDGTIHYRKLKDWEAIDSKGRVFQYRKLTSAELEAEETRMFLKKQFDADQAHAEKVEEAIKDAEREAKETARRREREERTGKREYGRERYISLEQARRRGYLGSGGSDNAEHPAECMGCSRLVVCGSRGTRGHHHAVDN